ncbi:MAG: GTP pyrophosphokinase [Ignavibacteriae bacterium]|nr:MAG: GTP pyrophosphokinase [Ignavibacteriota bacterium]
MIFRAIKFAVEAHEGHYRKGTNIPYITHLMNVMKILCENNCDEEVIVAGILHDVIEDTPYTINFIERKFGKRVASIVNGVSEKKIDQETGKEILWNQRKQRSIKYLQKKANQDELLVTCADKLDNILSIKSEYKQEGDEVWKRFKAGKEEQGWYYKELLEVFDKRSKEFGGVLERLTGEFAEAVNDVFKGGLK